MISSSSLLSSSSSSALPLHILRGLYRSLKSPPNLETMIVVGQKSATTTTTVTTTPNNNYNRNSNKHIKSRSNPTTSYLIQIYRKQQMKDNNDTTTNSQQLLVLQTNIAMNTLRLRTDMMERIKLQSLDAGVEEVLTPKEMSRRAAARAGLYMPKQSDYNDNNIKDQQPSEKKSK